MARPRRSPIGDTRPFRRPKHTGIVANDVAAEALKPLKEAVEGPLVLTPPLPQPGYLLVPMLDELVVMDNVELDRNGAYNWTPLPKSRGKTADSLAAWMGLPYEGAGTRRARRFSVGGGERAQSFASRKRAQSHAPGSELFETSCALMASGARTVLLTRWRTGGQTNLEIVREFVQELPNNSAAAAWQRSIAVARELPLDPSQEPRLKKLDDSTEATKASHPFFWAGYMLLDTGTTARAKEAEAAAESETASSRKAGGEKCGRSGQDHRQP